MHVYVSGSIKLNEHDHQNIWWRSTCIFFPKGESIDEGNNFFHIEATTIYYLGTLTTEKRPKKAPQSNKTKATNQELCEGFNVIYVAIISKKLHLELQRTRVYY